MVEGDFIDLRPDLVAGAIVKPDFRRAWTKPLPKQGKISSTQESPSYSDEEINRLLDRSQYKNSDGSGNWHPNMLAT